MFGIGSTELLVILIVALVVLGPKSLPGIAKTVGKVMGEFRRVSTEFQRTMNAEVANEEHEKRKKEAEEELFGKDKNSKEADASTAKASASSVKSPESPVVDTVAASSEAEAYLAHTDPMPSSSANAETPVSSPEPAVSIPADSPLAAAVAKAESEAAAPSVTLAATEKDKA